MAGPDGYQVGTAWVQVLPSFDTFQKRMAVALAKVGDVKIPAQMDLDTKKAEAAARAAESSLVKRPIKLRAELDERKFRAEIEKITAHRDEKVLGIDLNISKLKQKIQDLNRHRDDLKIDVDAEIAKAEAKIHHLEAGRHRVIIDAEVNSQKAEDALRRIEDHQRKINNNQTDINMEASDASRAVAILGALVAALGAVSYAAPAAAAALATVPHAILAIGQGVGTVAAGFHGVGDAVKALQTVEDQAATTATASSAKRVSAANRIASAESSLDRALASADHAAIQGAHQVQEARESLATAQVDAARAVQTAEDSLQSAQRNARDAQLALNDARKEAKERLDDLHISLAGAALDEEAAVLNVLKARERLAAAQKAGVKGLDLQEISLSARQAQQSLTEVRDRFADLKGEATAANRAGVNGSSEVVSAQRAVKDAAAQTQSAEQALARARTDGAARVAKAERAVDDARASASFAAAEASRSIADAQRQVAEASTAAGTQGSAAMDKLAIAMAKLTPQGRAFAHFIQDEAKPALKDLGAAAQETMLPKIQDAFHELLGLTPILDAALADTGNVIGDLALKGADMVTSGPWTADFVTIADRNNRMLGLMGDTGLGLLDVFRNITVASGPLIESILIGTEAWSEHFRKWIQGKRDSGELDVWFREMGIRIRELWGVVKQLTTGAVSLFQALAPLGRAVLHIIAPIAELIGNFAEAHPTLTTIIALFVLLGSTFVSFFRTLGGLGQAFRTSKGVFNSMIFGSKDLKAATEETTKATERSTEATGRWRQSIEGGSGLIGRTSTGLRSIADAYTAGATTAGNWATKVGTNAALAANRLGTELFGVSTKLETSGRSFGRFSTIAVGTFSTVTKVAAGTGSAIAKGVGGAVSGLTGALGGPFGIALTVATIGLGILASKQAEAADKAARHKAELQSLTDALVESSGAVDENVRKKIRLNLQDEGVISSARRLGVNVGLMVRAIGTGGNAAETFERSLKGVGDALINQGQFSDQTITDLNDLRDNIVNTGDTVDDYLTQIELIAINYQKNTGASDEARDSFRQQLIDYLRLADGYQGARGDFKGAANDAELIAEEQNSAATATERHYTALKQLQTQMLGQINKDIAYRQAQNNLAEAHQRVIEVQNDETASATDLQNAKLQEESAMLQLIDAAGAMAQQRTVNKSAAEQEKAVLQAQASEVAGLANKYGKTLPESIGNYLGQLDVAKTDTGKYIVKLDDVPPHVYTTARFNDKGARAAVKDYGVWLENHIKNLLGKTIGPSTGSSAKPTTMGDLLGLGTPPGKAKGAIVTPYAKGGLRPMPADAAQVVPPNSWRVIGDRMTGDEAFIPLDGSARSEGILAEAAARMGFSLVPMYVGGIVAMQDGAMAAPGGGKTVTSEGAALTLEPTAIDTMTGAVTDLVATGLAPLATEVTTTTAPAMATLETHAGVLAPAAVTKLNSLLPPLQGQLNRTAVVSGQTWSRIVGTSRTGAGQIGGYLSTLRGGMSASRTAMTSMANAAVTQFGRMRPAAADPIRWILANPINAGLIGAWARLNKDFALKKPVGKVPIPFAFGGRVPGYGDGDTVDAKLTPGEFVWSKQAIANMGGVAKMDEMHRMARAGIVGPNARLGDKGDALERLKLMRTIPLDGLGFAYGGVQPHVARAGHEVEQKFGPFPGGIGGVGARGNISDHPLGLALDFMTMKDSALGDRVAQYLQSNSKRLLIKYLIWKQKINQGSAWTPMEDRGSITANHFDHVHSSFLRFGQLGKIFTGPGPGGDVSTYFAQAFQQLAQVPKLFPGNKAAAVAGEVARQAVTGAERYANDKIGTSQVAGSPQVVAAVRAVANRFGWGSGPEWDALSRLISGESGWDPKAANPSSSARGLFQKLTSMHGPIEPTVKGQAEWGLNYIKGSYGSPSNAFRQWSARSPHWYDDGGMLPPGYSTVFNGTGRPEHVLNGPQWNSLISMADNSSGGDFSGNLYLSSGELLGIVDGRIDQANTATGRSLASRLR